MDHYDRLKAVPERDIELEEKIRKLVQTSKNQTSELLAFEARRNSLNKSQLLNYTRKELSLTPTVRARQPLYQSTP